MQEASLLIERYVPVFSGIHITEITDYSLDDNGNPTAFLLKSNTRADALEDVLQDFEATGILARTPPIEGNVHLWYRLNVPSELTAQAAEPASLTNEENEIVFNVNNIVQNIDEDSFEDASIVYFKDNHPELTVKALNAILDMCRNNTILVITKTSIADRNYAGCKEFTWFNHGGFTVAVRCLTAEAIVKQIKKGFYLLESGKRLMFIPTGSQPTIDNNIDKALTYINHQLNTVQKEIEDVFKEMGLKAVKDALEGSMSRYEACISKQIQLSQELAAKRSEQETLNRHIASLTIRLAESEKDEGWKSMYKSFMMNSEIEDVFIDTNGQINVVTKILKAINTMTEMYHVAGRFNITLRKLDIVIFNMMGSMYNGHPAFHSNGITSHCYGNIASDVNTMLGSKDYENLMPLLLMYLTHPVASDAWGCSVHRQPLWPFQEVTEEKLARYRENGVNVSDHASGLFHPDKKELLIQMIANQEGKNPKDAIDIFAHKRKD